MLQICSDYHSLPDIGNMNVSNIRFFYHPLIKNLIEAQISAKKK